MPHGEFGMGPYGGDRCPQLVPSVGGEGAQSFLPPVAAVEGVADVAGKLVERAREAADFGVGVVGRQRR
ncbi:hypothetical protein ACGFZR_08090 [Streptomyces sp. NPDC048241]|uniref:hypothetical protein n=1 Tax=Streptomyces sp. NPDC048241 TaxID=3365521 RepID=UPI00371A7B1E